MCGRFTLATPPPRLLAAFEAEPEAGLEEQVQLSWNVAPTRQVLGVTDEDGHRVLGRFSWGLLPSWAKDPAMAGRTFNARAETVATKPTFRAAFASRRCLVPADPGFYEWSKRPADRTTPYLFRRADGEPMAFAGLWEVWRPGPDQPWRRSLTIVTTAAGPDVAPVHDRQPVVLERAAWGAWLERRRQDRPALEALLVAGPAGVLERVPVSRAVGSTANDGPELLHP